MVILIAEEPHSKELHLVSMLNNYYAKLTSISQQTQARSTLEANISQTIANIKNLFSHFCAARSKDYLTKF